MVSNLTEALPCPKFTLFKTKAYLPIIKIIFLNRFATDDHGALMSYLEGTLRYLWLGGGGEFFKIRVGVGMCVKYIRICWDFFGGITFRIMLFQLSCLCYHFAQMY